MRAESSSKESQIHWGWFATGLSHVLRRGRFSDYAVGSRARRQSQLFPISGDLQKGVFGYVPLIRTIPDKAIIYTELRAYGREG
jgi:hypothetical protein